MWFQIELPEPVMLTEIQFNSTAQSGGRGAVPGARLGGAGAVRGASPRRRRRRPWDLPPRLSRAAVDGRQDVGRARRPKGRGSGSTTAIAFRPVRAKFVRITQTATVENAPAWSIQRLRLYQAPADGDALTAEPRHVGLPPSGAQVIHLRSPHVKFAASFVSPLPL